MKRVKSVSGIRRKILFGFVSLGSLLFLSGLISFFELSKLTNTTQSIISVSVNDVEFSKLMLDAVQEQNTALLQIVSLKNHDYDSVLISGKQDFENAFNKAAELHRNTSKLEAIYIAKTNYNQVVDQIFEDSTRTESIEWFTNIYRTSYYDLTLAVKNFMVDTQHSIDTNTATLKNNAYRAIMPGIIALGIAIIIIVMFFGLVDMYYIQPVLKITKGLGNYLNSKIPFNVNVDGRDEITLLKEYIDELMAIVKKKEQ